MKIGLNLKEFKVTVQNEPDGPVRTTSSFEGLIADQLIELKQIRDARRPGSDNAHINQDIRVYEHILAQSDAHEAARIYLTKADALRKLRGGLVKKIDVVRSLGWAVE